MPRYARALFTAILLSLIAFALPAVTSPATAGEEPDPMFDAPEVGRCYDVSNRVIEKDTIDADTVSCSKKHRLQIVGVFKLPAGVPLDWDDSDTQAAYNSKCPRAVLKETKATRLNYVRSSYGRYGYFPSTEQQEAGARWYVCAIARIARPGSWIRAQGTANLKKAPRLNARLCMDRSANFTTCSVNDTFKPKSTKIVTATEARVPNVARRICRQKYPNRDWLAWSWKRVLVKGKHKWLYGITCYMR